MSKAMASSPSQESRSWGDQLQPKEIAPSGSPVEVVTTFNKINSSSNGLAALEATIQDVEDALLQIEIAAAKEPPLNSVSCCSPTHAARGNLTHFYSPQPQQMLSPPVLLYNLRSRQQVRQLKC
jgi:hypothetical protein